MPEESAESEKTDWLHLLSRTLPFVDIFLPSLDELLFMLDRKVFEQLQQAGGLQDYIKKEPGAGLVSQLGHRLLEMGAKIAMIKLGDCGAYLCTAGLESIIALGSCRLRPLAKRAGHRVPWGGDNWRRRLDHRRFLRRPAAGTFAGRCAHYGCSSRSMQRRSPGCAERRARLGGRPIPHPGRLGSFDSLSGTGRLGLV
jgi:hypothetical protein